MSLQPVDPVFVKQKCDVASSCGKSETAGGRVITQNRVHLNKEVDDQNLSTNTCLSKSSSPASLKSHAQHNTNIGDETQRNKRSMENETYKCDICDKQFTMKSQLTEHIRNIHQNTEQESRLDVTGEESTTAGTSTRRRAKAGRSDELTLADERYSCGICNKSFPFIGNLKVHERIHTGEKPFSCEVCKQKFTQIGNLKAHKRIHTGEKPYTCAICKHSFNSSPNLKKHERIHSAEKQYSCGKCQQKFSVLSYLKRHERIHIERIYSCGVCKEKFTNNAQLKTHKRLNMECWRV